MADEVAGSILVELKAQAARLKAEFKDAQARVDAFGKTAQDTAGKVTKAGHDINAGMEEGFSKHEAKHTAHVSHLIGRLISLQFALSQLGHKGAEDASHFEHGIEVAEKGLSTFATVVSIMPNKVGVVVGLIAGIGTSILALVGPTKEETARMEALAESIKKVGTAQKDIFKQRTGGLINEDILQKVEKITDPEKIKAGDAEGTLAARQRALDVEVKHLAILKEELLLQKRINGNVEQVAKLTEDVAKAEEAVEARAKGVAEAKGPAKLQEEIRAFNQTLADLVKQSNITDKALEEGLIDPAQAIQKEYELARQRVEAFLALSPEALKKFTVAKDIFGQQFQDRKAEQATIQFLKEEEDLQREAARKLREDQQSRAGDFASGLSRSIGGAVTDGILQGKGAMEILANTGQSLFANFLNKTVDNFEKGMVAAFQSIGGEGGAILGGALTAVLGVLGGIFASRSNKSTEKFTGAKSKITDSTPVRGIVAGPSSVAIAAVGEDIARANGPMVSLLEVIAKATVQTAQNTRGGGGGPAGAGGVGAVFVPTA